MPEICVFFGIRITMNFSDHYPPHFYVTFAENKAMIDILNGCVLKGYLPPKQLKLVLAWAALHEDELMQNWELARSDKPINKIAPIT